MNEKIVLKSGWIKVEKTELDTLREKMRAKYEKAGGSKKFNSHLPNYEELRKVIKTSLRSWMAETDRKIEIHGQEHFEIIPGNTFFRDLFFTKRNAGSPQFQEYNIEICYLYAFGKTRLEYRIGGGQDEEKAEEQQKEKVTDSKGESIRIILSSTLNNMIEAEKIKNHLIDNFGLQVETETRNSQAYSKGTLNDLYSNLDNDTIIFSLISRDYLQNENCVKELIEFTDNNFDLYSRNTFHILHNDIYEGDFNIFDSLGRSELLKYWMLRIEQLEENHKLLIGNKKEKGFFKKLRSDLDELKEIIEGLHRLLFVIKDNPYSVLYEIFLTKINNPDILQKLLPKKTATPVIDSKLETTYKRIKIPSNNNPKKPEFPPEPFYKPKFPASDTFKIEVPGFKNVWLKDESTNPTGTHKDRLAWEVVIKYKSLIEGIKYKDHASLPQMSIISSGSAAIAIQHMFNLFKIPTKLKVLVDNHLNPAIKNDIEKIGCELYQCDLSRKLLSPEEIKELTDNNSGIDITYREVLDPAHDNYYDWMCYEILREQPKYCFVPFGTGDLFINILNIVKIEYFNSFVSKHDPRFIGSIRELKKCHFIGASSNEPDTRMDKLFSNYLPSINSFKKYIAELKDEYNCVGEMTDFYYVNEEYVDKALEIAGSQNLKFEPSGMAGLALLLQMKEKINPASKILIVNTGKTKAINDLLKA